MATAVSEREIIQHFGYLISLPKPLSTEVVAELELLGARWEQLLLDEEGMTMIDNQQLQDWFGRHMPDTKQQERIDAVQVAFIEFAHRINFLVPDGMDKSAVMRKLREAKMTCVHAIAAEVKP